MNQIELKALAKINLGLDVLGKRENGYHDVRMVMQSVYLYDEVKITKRKEPGIVLSTNLGFLPSGEGNIAYKSIPVQLQAHRGAVVCQGHRDGAAAFPGKAEKGAGISCHVVIGEKLLGFQ